MDSSQREKEGFTIIVYFFVDDGFQVSVPAKQLNGHIIFVAQCVSRKYKFLSCIKTVFFCFFDYACKIVLVVVQ